MMSSKIRAYCIECKCMVSDDLFQTEEGTVNKHEHEIVVLMERGAVPPGAIITSVMEMTPETYLQHASQLDAELIVGRIKARYNIPFGEKIITEVVTLILKAIRETAIEMEMKERKRSKLRQKLEAGAEPKVKPKPKAKKRKKTADKPLT